MKDTELAEIGKQLEDIATKAIGKITLKGDVDKFLAFSTSKGLKTFRALMLLCKNGYGQDAGILARSLFELSLCVEYVLKNDTESLTKRWLDHDKIFRAQILDYAEKEKITDDLPNELNINNIENIKKEAQKAQETHKYKNKNRWIDKKYSEMATDVGSQKAYDTVYKLLCNLQHSSPNSINEYFKEKDIKGIKGIEIDTGQSDAFIELSLIIAIDFYGVIVGDYIKNYKLSLSSDFDSHRKQFKKYTNRL